MAEMLIETDSTEHPVTLSTGTTAMRIESFWCSKSEESKLRVYLLDYEEVIEVYIWDGHRLVRDERVESV